MEFQGILDLSKQYTDLEVVEAAATFLLTQAAQSANEESGACMYRGCDGLKCAVGAFIPDSCYRFEMEFKPIEHALSSLLVDQNSQLGQFVNGHMGALKELQFVHDQIAVEHWGKYFDLLRTKYSATSLPQRVAVDVTLKRCGYVP